MNKQENAEQLLHGKGHPRGQQAGVRVPRAPASGGDRGSCRHSPNSGPDEKAHQHPVVGTGAPAAGALAGRRSGKLAAVGHVCSLDLGYTRQEWDVWVLGRHAGSVNTRSPAGGRVSRTATPWGPYGNKIAWGVGRGAEVTRLSPQGAQTGDGKATLRGGHVGG